jgi:hypothetical protein
MPSSLIAFLFFILNQSCESGPGVRNGHAMTYHDGLDKVVLFGGATEDRVLDDLWILDKDRWVKVDSKGPKARTFPSLVYDPEQKRLILFGGNTVLFGRSRDSSTFLNDCWEWRNNKWRKLESNNVPSPRAEASIVNDKKNKRIILYGGYRFDKDGKSVRLFDTWAFKNNEWLKLSDKGAISSNGTCIVYRDGDIILYGGNRPPNVNDSIASESTWLWKKTEWVCLNIKSPHYFNAAMSYDPDLKFVLRFGGWNGQKRLNETWMLKDVWTKLTSATLPAARNHARLVYDKLNKRHVLFGGHDGDNVFGDLWIFENHQWKEVSPCPPKRRIENGH